MEAKSDLLNRLRHPITGAAEADQEVQCPSCETKLRRHEVAQHCEEEMQRLREMQMKAVTVAGTKIDESVTNEIKGGSGGNEERRKPWTVFQRVQRNRHSRLRLRTRKRTVPAPAPPPPPPTEHPCPVCNVSYPPDEIQRHAEHCLHRTAGNGISANGTGSNSSNDEDEGDEYEEYEWAGQKRIRVSSLLQGGYASIGIGQTITQINGGSGGTGQPDDEDEDLNVDEDDTQIYGPAQYGENDVIPPTLERNGSDDEGNDVASYVRRLITGTTNSTNTSTSNMETNEREIAAVGNNHIPKVEPTDEQASTSLNTNTAIEAGTATKMVASAASKTYRQIIESLKAKLRHYENHVQSKFKCLICLDDYRNPAISVSCWHVHCEDCWLRSLGVRKLCPQCNLITTPKDLRRIYM